MKLERMPEAYQQGYAAYQWGDPAHRCPYGKALEMRQRMDWFAGYWDADTEMNGFRDAHEPYPNSCPGSRNNDQVSPRAALKPDGVV